MICYFLTTVHNRKNKTIRSLSSILEQSNKCNLQPKFYIVDDGSTDSTSQALQSLNPKINIIYGDGNLYWARGMRKGWLSLKDQKFDALIVFNDDVELFETGLEKILSIYNKKRELQSNVIVSGAFCDSSSKTKTTYGGYIGDGRLNPLSFKMVDPSSHDPKELDTINMNFAVISPECLMANDFLNHYFIHGGADMEYGIRAKKNGTKIFLTSEYIGVCDRNKDFDLFSSEMSVMQKLKFFFGPKNESIKVRFLYHKDHGGRFWIFFFLAGYVKLFIALAITPFLNLVFKWNKVWKNS